MAQVDEQISPEAAMALLKGRRSIRRYRPDPVPDKMIEQLLEAGRWAPSASNRQPWHFIVVRDQAILREVAENYDFDGINLDFGRHPPFLPMGQQWEHREALTEFVRRVRLMLQEVARRRGRPYLLSVRVADTVPGCHFDGLDVESWVQQNLVDMIIIGTRSIQVDMPGFRRITEGSHVKLYPCIDQHHSPDGYHAVAAPQFFRGLAANWRHQGADGVATFNFWNETPESAAVVGTNGPRLADGRSVHARAYREMGDPKTLAMLDKWFVVSRRYGGGWEDRWDNYTNMNHQAPLPLALPPEPAWVEVYVADDVAARAEQVKRLQLRLQVSGEPHPQHVWVKFNGIRLQNPVLDTGWWSFALTPKQMAVGRNLLTVRYPRPGAAESPITLEKVEVHVAYRNTPLQDAPAKPVESKAIALSPEHLAAVNRPRRIIVNYDDQCFGFNHAGEILFGRVAAKDWSDLRFTMFDEPGCQVDSVYWAMDEGNLAWYPSKVLPVTECPHMRQWLDAGIDVVRMLVEKSHQRGLEAFWTHRVNGVDRQSDGVTRAVIPMKQQHPDWLLEGGWWNLAVPGVQDYKAAVLRELVHKYDFDGIDLDFARHPPHLPIGRQWEHREDMTDFIRRVRRMLQDVAKRRGRPCLLSVRVPATVPGCHYDGLDVGTWIREGLIDLVIMGVRSTEVDISGFRRLTGGTHVKLYPCIDDAHSADGYHTPPIEFFRGVAADFWEQGADGIQLFNFVTSKGPIRQRFGGVPGPPAHEIALHELGDPEMLPGKDKMFTVLRRYGGGWEDVWDSYQNMNHHGVLPRELPPEPAWIELYVADDIAAHADQVKSVQLRMQISGNPDPELVWVKFNGIRLQNAIVEGVWWTFALKPKQCAVGRNLLTVRYPRPDRREHPIALEKVEVHVSYRNAPKHFPGSRRKQ